MKMYHRLAGDPPRRGFGDAIGTPGFPAGVSWADGIRTMRLPLRAPFRLPETGQNGLLEHHEAYEYQSLGYGRPVVIRSMMGVSLNGGNVSRPHGFSHLVAPLNEQDKRVATDFITPAQLLCYDDFQTLEAFWALSPEVQSLPATEWDPPAPQACERHWEGELPQGMLRTLIARYWKALGDRAFTPKGDVSPVRVCLSRETDCRRIIREAKAFWASVVLTRLPAPVMNIASMSVPVPAQALQVFQSTALAFLYPESGVALDERTFDLRSGSFTPLPPEEDAFAERVLAGAQSPLLDALYGRYRHETGCAAPEHCPPMADYEVVFAVDRIENGPVAGPEAAVALLAHWRELDMALERRHGLSLPVRRSILFPVMKRVLGRLPDSPAPLPLNEALTAFLWRQALTTQDEPSLETLCTLLERHQRARLAPFFLSQLPIPPTSEQEERTALLMERFLNRCFVEPSPDAAVVGALHSPSFLQYCQKNERFGGIAARYVHRELDVHPEDYLLMLPLSTVFLDGCEQLKRTLALLLSRYVDTPPQESLCLNVHAALDSFLNDENAQLLARYLAELFIRHRGDPDAFYHTAQHIGGDTGGSLITILKALSETPAQLDQPLSTAETARLTAELLVRCAEPTPVFVAFHKYVERVLARSLETGTDRFPWLCEQDGGHRLMHTDTQLAMGCRYICDCLERTGDPLPSRDFGILLQWASGTGRKALDACRDRLLTAYDQLGVSGEAQAGALLPYFGSVAKYSYLRKLCLCAVHKRLLNGWNPPNDYWGPVDAARDDLRRGGLTPREALDPSVIKQGERLIAAQYRECTEADGFEAALKRNQARPGDEFFSLWKTGLRQAFAARYPVLLRDHCRTVDDLETLERTVHTLDAEAALAHTGAWRCGRAALVAHRLCQQAGALTDGQLVRQTQAALSGLFSCRDVDAYAPLRRLILHRYLTAPRTADTSFTARVAIRLLCTARDDSRFNVKELLALTTEGAASPPRKPCAPEALPTLQAIAALFATLERISPPYTETLRGYLLTEPGWAAYTKALRADRRRFDRCFPWLSAGWTDAGPPVTQAFERWLNG